MATIALLLASCYCLAFATRYDLGGTDWQFRSSNGTVRGSAAVPGDIYQDLQKAGVIGEPLFGEGDVDLRWVPRTDWVYERQFDVPTELSGKVSLIYIEIMHWK
jgi:beta-galactosidase/beta-glucuronidase